MTSISSATFVKSSSSLEECPPPDLPEYAFIGRSNVGKSSLINYLTSNSNMAKVSSTPGKTKLINHFLINQAWYLVDLPGYGYAKVSKKDRETYRAMIEEYALYRQNLCLLFVLVDSRIDPQEIDLEFITWCGENQIPLALVMTKTDKLNRERFLISKKNYISELNKVWEEIPPIFASSSIKKTGAEDILEMISSINNTL